MADDTPFHGLRGRAPSSGRSMYATPGDEDHEPVSWEAGILAVERLITAQTARLDRHRSDIISLQSAFKTNSNRTDDLQSLFDEYFETKATVSAIHNQLETFQAIDLPNLHSELDKVLSELGSLRLLFTQQSDQLTQCLQLKEDMETEILHLHNQLRAPPEPRPSNDYRPRPTLPEKFDGTPSKFTGFLLQCNRVFELYPTAFPTDLAKVGLITSLFIDAALTWVSPYFKTNDPILSDLPRFTTAFTSAFSDTDKIERDTRKLDGLSMTSTVQEYVRQFRALSADLGYNDVALRGRFVGGLPDQLNDLLLSMPPPASFDELVAQALTIGGRLAARQEAKQDARRQPRFSSPFLGFNGGRAPTNPTGPRGPLSDAERARRRNNNLCMFCGHAGHGVRDCPRAGPRHQAPPPGPGPARAGAPQPIPARVRVLAIRDAEHEDDQGNDQP